MTLWMKTSLIWQRLRQRFKSFSVIQPEEPSLLENVQPVTNVDVLLQTGKLYAATMNLAASPTDILTVPDGKKWTIVRTTKGGSTGAIYLRIYKSATEFCEITMAGTGAIFTGYPEPLVLEQGWKIQSCDGVAGDTGVAIRVFYLEEDAF